MKLLIDLAPYDKVCTGCMEERGYAPWKELNWYARCECALCGEMKDNLSKKDFRRKELEG